MVILTRIIIETKPMWKGKGKRGCFSHYTGLSVEFPVWGHIYLSVSIPSSLLLWRNQQCSCASHSCVELQGACSHCEWQPLISRQFTKCSWRSTNENTQEKWVVVRQGRNDSHRDGGKRGFFSIWEEHITRLLSLPQGPQEREAGAARPIALIPWSDPV